MVDQDFLESLIFFFHVLNKYDCISFTRMQYVCWAIIYFVVCVFFSRCLMIVNLIFSTRSSLVPCSQFVFWVCRGTNDIFMLKNFMCSM